MPRAATVALFVFVVVLVAPAAACSNTVAETAGTQRVCKVDDDCGKGAFCTQANVCRTDCYDDVDCFGGSDQVQCNVHGQCIDTSGDTGPPSDAPLDETPPYDAPDAKADAVHDGPPPDVIDPEIGP